MIESSSIGEKELAVQDDSVKETATSINLPITTYHALNRVNGRLVIDPEEARIEFGDEIASKLKLSPDGTKVLWPQPSDDPEDPQNWADRRKYLQLFIITISAMLPEFGDAIGVPDSFALAQQFDTTPSRIIDVSTNWTIFLLAWGAIFAVMLIRKYGRLPVLFWSQLISLGLLVGCAFSSNLTTFAVLRCIRGFVSPCPATAGLFVVTDMFPFHLQARNLNIWSMALVIAPYLSAFLFGFVVARTSWRWTYGSACIFIGLVVLLIALCGEETMYDRNLSATVRIPTSGSQLRRLQALIGITGMKMAKYRPSWKESTLIWFQLIWRPHLLSILLFQAVSFGFGIGVNLTNVVFLREPKPVGYGFGPLASAGIYTSPVVAIVLGEVICRYFNDWLMNTSIRRNKGVFEAETRLWACYAGTFLNVSGLVIMGAAFQYHLGVAALVIGWGTLQISSMLITVGVYTYINNCFPNHPGEVSGFFSLFRQLGGFSVPYFQVPWATKDGAMQTFGIEAAIVASMFLLVIPMLQIKGRRLRERFSL